MTVREEYFDAIKIFLEEELVKVIYETDKICILNLANSVYAVTDYTISDYPVAFMFNKKAIKEIVDDNDKFYRYVKSIINNEKVFERALTDFGPKNLKVLRELKNKTDINGPSNNVDLDMENRILKKQEGNKSTSEKGVRALVKKLKNYLTN